MFFSRKERDGKGRFVKGHKAYIPNTKIRYTNPYYVNTYGQPFIKIIGWGDTHISIEEPNKTLPLKPFLTFLRYTKPEIFICGGDVWDLSYLSHWNSERFSDIGHEKIKQLVKKESEYIYNILKEIRAIKSIKKMYFIVGNHEDWLNQYQQKYDKLHKWSIEKWLRLKELDIEVIPLGGHITIGHLTFKHGETYGTENPAKQAIIKTHRNIVIFHFHKELIWPGYSDIDAMEKIKGFCVPGYCRAAAMKYLKKRDNDWSNGFFMAYMKQSGKFTPQMISVSPSGNFIYHDREFE